MSAWTTEVERLRRSIEAEKEALAAIESLGELAGADWVYASGYQKAVLISVYDGNAKEIALLALNRIREISDRPPLKADKQFDSSSGKISYTVRGLPNGWKTVVSGGDPRCRVERIEEEVEVPEKVEAAHTETKVRYVIDNPEECGAV